MLRKWFVVPVMGSLALLVVADAAQAQLRARLEVVRERRMERRDMRRGVVVENRVMTEAPVTSSTARVSFYNTPINQGPANAAQIRIMLPTPEAKVLFDGNPTTQVGIDRLYYTPPLTVGAKNTYLVKVTFMQGTQEMTQERALNVAPGMTYVVNFAPPAETLRVRPR